MFEIGAIVAEAIAPHRQRGKLAGGYRMISSRDRGNSPESTPRLRLDLVYGRREQDVLDDRRIQDTTVRLIDRTQGQREQQRERNHRKDDVCGPDTP